ncbi:MAG: response regulator [Elusimicrobia bacterium]|nr:response regulator [Elusimicrobiota bacterium]
MRAFWIANLDVAYFFYGLAFVVAGLLIAVQRRDLGDHRVSRVVALLAAFAGLHGLHEWSDLWELSRGYDPLVHPVGVVLLTASFVFLYEFGRSACAMSRPASRLASRWSTAALTAACLALMAAGGREPEVWPRYLLALPGGLLAAAGLGLHIGENPALQSPMARRCLKADAVALGAYALLAGLVVPRADFFPASVLNEETFLRLCGLPVPVLRSLCAVAVAAATWRLLFFFSREANERLRREQAPREQAESKLLQAQKLEAVGLLAGGMAHDFNNVLTTIVGYNYFLLEGLSPESPLRPLSLEIRKAADLAASLTRQILAVTRKQVVQPKVMEANSVIHEMAKMFRRLLGENIKLEVHAHPSAWPVKMDCGQLEQVLMNLVVNARDAMPHGGRLTLATRNVAVDGRRQAHLPAGIPEGHYLCLEVHDTGSGMTPEVQAKVFEPFFTTKEVGRGTGLGLSTVQGIVKEYRGHIAVASEPGKGSVFRVFLPRAEGGAEALVPGEVRKTGVEGHETILVVEDNAALRALVKRILREKGYRVFSAPTGEEALSLGRRLKERIDLLLCDLILPDSHGLAVAKELCAARPGLKVAYMSGYPGGVLASDLAFNGTVLIEKPFSPEALLDALRRQLDAKRAEAQAKAPPLPGLGSGQT